MKKNYYWSILLMSIIFFLSIVSCATMNEVPEKDLIIKNGVLTKYSGRQRNIIIPDNLGITAIGDWAFKDSKIISIKIPQGVTSINYAAFSGCEKLKKIDLPNSLVTINQAFGSCISLASIKLPSSVRNIGPMLFWPHDIIIEVDEGNNKYATIDGILFNKEFTSILHYPSIKKDKEYSIPDSVRIIGEYAFRAAPLRVIKIPNGVEVIEYSAFSATLITSIEFPKTIKSISSSAFSQCENITSLKFPEGTMTKVDYQAFFNCFNLRRVDLPLSVKVIEKRAFYDCRNLQVVTFAGDAIYEILNLFVNAYGENIGYKYKISWENVPDDVQRIIFTRW